MFYRPAAVLGLAILVQCAPAIPSVEIHTVSIVAPKTGVRDWPVFLRLNGSSNGSSSLVDWTFLPLKRNQSSHPPYSCIDEMGTVQQRCRTSTVAVIFHIAGECIIRAIAANSTGSDRTSIRVSNHNNLSQMTLKRKEIRSLASSEWKSFVGGLYTLKQLGIYDLLVAVHVQSMQKKLTPGVDVAHGGPSFLPWHRMFLLVLERALVEYTNTTVGIPYWNWTIDAALEKGPMNSEIWTDKWMGPTGNFWTERVESGPFCSLPECQRRWPIRQDLNGPFLTRRIGFQRPTPPTVRDVDETMGRTDYDSPPFNNRSQGFRAALEGWTAIGHNAVHAFIGGSMALPSSPNDPIFFMHHAFVDKLWSEWAHRCTQRCYRPDHHDHGNHTGHRLNDTLWPFSIPINDMSLIDLNALGYSYNN